MSQSPISAILCLLVPLTALAIWAIRRGARDLWAQLRALPRWQQIGAVLALALLVGYGGDKPQPVPRRYYEILTALSGGGITDASGSVATGTAAAALDQFADEAWRITDALADVVAAASNRLAGIAADLGTNDYATAYIALDLPRGTPLAQNHNVMAGFERFAQTVSNLTAWVWFSELPATNVNVVAQYSLTEGRWDTLSPITNHWPATEFVNGAECVRYEYALPPGIHGTPLRPQYEIEFGGWDPEEYLSVPADGVVVSVGATDYQPYTGWDYYNAGLPDELQIRYQGGIAIEARQYGQTLRGRL